MATERVKRRLTAILAADVAGYSRLMAADEEGTLAQLKAHRHALVDPKIIEHRGRTVKTTGDGMLVEFASVVDALRCAVEIQSSMAERNAKVPRDRRLELRVGIHQGDVIIDSNDIFGDGVNVAARLEGLAEPGGICVSARVQEDARGKLDVTFESAGEKQLKNIDRLVHVYRVRADGRAWPSPVLPLPDKPSIAVLPFQNMSGDPEQEYFADGIVDDIITALTRMRWLFVIARNSSFTYKGRAVDVKQLGRELGVRYVLQGAVRKSANQVRITTQLIDAETGTHIWAERYDRDLADIFALQDEMTDKVAGAIEPELLRTEGRAAISRREHLSAWDLVQQGTWHFHQITREGVWRARELFREALKVDPQMAEANIWLGRVTGALLSFGWSADRAADLKEGLDAALRAVQIDERNPYSHYALVIPSVFSGAVGRAILAAETAIKLAPSFALGYLALGFARLNSGRAAEAADLFERGLRLNPYDPQNFVWLQGLALAQYFAGNREAALQAATQALNIRPEWPPALETMAICCAALDRVEEARSFVERMRHQDKPPDRFAQMKAHRPQWAAEMELMLRIAGLSE